MIFTRNFYNVHLSHIELFDVGQPRLARYPIHWHHAHYVGAKGKYDDPSSVESLRKVSYAENTLATYESYDPISISYIEALKSIHDSYSRFVTVHGTHEAIVKDVVGYNCHGHGFFLEDGYETENKERFLTDL